MLLECRPVRVLSVKLNDLNCPFLFFILHPHKTPENRNPPNGPALERDNHLNFSDIIKNTPLKQASGKAKASVGHVDSCSCEQSGSRPHVVNSSGCGNQIGWLVSRGDEITTLEWNWAEIWRIPALFGLAKRAGMHPADALNFSRLRTGVNSAYEILSSTTSYNMSAACSDSADVAKMFLRFSGMATVDRIAVNSSQPAARHPAPRIGLKPIRAASLSLAI